MVIGQGNVWGICQETLGTPVDTSKLQSNAMTPLIQTVPSGFQLDRIWLIMIPGRVKFAPLIPVMTRNLTNT